MRKTEITYICDVCGKVYENNELISTHIIFKDFDKDKGVNAGYPNHKFDICKQCLIDVGIDPDYKQKSNITSLFNMLKKYLKRGDNV